MNGLEAMIRKLCMDCKRRSNICGKYPPTYEDAYRCKWDEAQLVFKEMDKAFSPTPPNGEGE